MVGLGVQVAGKWRGVIVAVGNWSRVGAGRGGKGFRFESGLMKTFRKRIPRARVPIKTTMVAMFHRIGFGERFSVCMSKLSIADSPVRLRL